MRAIAAASMSRSVSAVSGRCSETTSLSRSSASSVTPLADGLGLRAAAGEEHARPQRREHRRQPAGNRSVAHEADRPAAHLAVAVLDLHRLPPSLPGARRRVEAGDAAQGGEDEEQRHLGDGLRVRARHVADRHAAAPGRVQVDRVDPDADLLDQPQRGGPVEDGLGHRVEEVPEHLGVRHRRPVARTVRHRADGDAQPLPPLDLGHPSRQARTGRVVEDDPHSAAAIIRAR